MAEPITIRGLDKVQAGFRSIANFEGSNLLMKDLGNEARRLILDRTSRGKDVDGDPFDPYSKSYNRTRAKKGLPTEIVDLFFRGTMLSALTYTAGELEVKLFFLSTFDSEGVRNDAKAYYNNERREFFALSATDIEKLTSQARDYVSELTNTK